MSKIKEAWEKARALLCVPHEDSGCECNLCKAIDIMDEAIGE